MNPATTKPAPSMRVQAFWLVIAKFIAELMNLPLPFILAKLMTQTDYGVYKQIFLFSVSITNIASLGVGISAFYFIPRYPERGSQVALNILIYNGVVGLACFAAIALYPEILQKLFGTDVLVSNGMLMGILPLLFLTTALVHHIPTALEDVKGSTLLIAGTQGIKALSILAAPLLFPGIRNLLICFILGQLLTSVILLHYLYKKFGRFWSTFEWSFFKTQLAYSFPGGVLGWLYVMKKDMHSYFVSAMLGPAEYAVYAVGSSQLPFTSVILESVSAVLLVRATALQKIGRFDEIRRTAAAAMSRLATVQFPTAALLLVIGYDLIVLLYRREYAPSYPIFAVNLLVLPLSVLAVDPVLRAFVELRKYVVVVRFLLVALMAVGLAPLIRELGLIGAVAAAVLFELIERIIYGWRTAIALQASWKDVKLFTGIVGVAIVTSIAAAASYGVRNLIDPDLLLARIVAATACMSVIYLAGVYLLHLPGSEEITLQRLSSLASNVMRKVKRA